MSRRCLCGRGHARGIRHPDPRESLRKAAHAPQWSAGGYTVRVMMLTRLIAGGMPPRAFAARGLLLS